MTVHVLAEAGQELQDAIVHYDKIDVTLSRRLKIEAARVLQWIGHNPELPRLRPRGYSTVRIVNPLELIYGDKEEGV